MTSEPSNVTAAIQGNVMSVKTWMMNTIDEDGVVTLKAFSITGVYTSIHWILNVNGILNRMDYTDTQTLNWQFMLCDIRVYEVLIIVRNTSQTADL